MAALSARHRGDRRAEDWSLALQFGAYSEVLVQVTETGLIKSPGVQTMTSSMLMYQVNRFLPCQIYDGLHINVSVAKG
jgi:hypothetical protein